MRIGVLTVLLGVAVFMVTDSPEVGCPLLAASGLLAWWVWRRR